MNVPAIYSELRNQSVSNINSILKKSIVITFFGYWLAAFIGYSTFSTYENVSLIMEP